MGISRAKDPVNISSDDVWFSHVMSFLTSFQGLSRRNAVVLGRYAWGTIFQWKVYEMVPFVLALLFFISLGSTPFSKLFHVFLFPLGGASCLSDGTCYHCIASWPNSSRHQAACKFPLSNSTKNIISNWAEIYANHYVVFPVELIAFHIWPLELIRPLSDDIGGARLLGRNC